MPFFTIMYAVVSDRQEFEYMGSLPLLQAGGVDDYLHHLISAGRRAGGRINVWTLLDDLFGCEKALTYDEKAKR